MKTIRPIGSTFKGIIEAIERLEEKTKPFRQTLKALEKSTEPFRQMRASQEKLLKAFEKSAEPFRQERLALEKSMETIRHSLNKSLIKPAFLMESWRPASLNFTTLSRTIPTLPEVAVKHHCEGCRCFIPAYEPGPSTYL